MAEPKKSNKAKYPLIRINRTAEEIRDPSKLLTKILTRMNNNAQVDVVDIKNLINVTERFDSHTPIDDWDATFRKYVTLQKSRK